MNRKEKETSNYHYIRGVIHSIGVPRNVTKDQDKEPFYVMSVILEHREVVRGNPRSIFLNFEIKNKKEDHEAFRQFDIYEEGDDVIITFKVDGKWKRPTENERIFTSLQPVRVERAIKNIDYKEKDKEDKNVDYNEYIIPPDLVENDGEEESNDLPF